MLSEKQMLALAEARRWLAEREESVRNAGPEPAEGWWDPVVPLSWLEAALAEVERRVVEVEQLQAENAELRKTAPRKGRTVLVLA